MAVSAHGYTDDYGPNVANILVQGARLIKGKVPSAVRNELRAAVKAGILGHFPKEGLKPEAFFHPNNRNTAAWMRDREASYAVECIAKVVGCNTDLLFSGMKE